MKKLKVLFCFACLAFALTVPASAAYIDPSVASTLLQGIIAVVVIAAAVAGTLWRKAKKKAQQVLNIDEDAKKTVEEDIVVFDDAEKAAEDVAAEAEAAAEDVAAEAAAE